MKNLTNRPQHLAMADLDGGLQGFKKARELSQEECSCVGGGRMMADDGDDYGSGRGTFSVSVSASGGTNDKGTSNFIGTVLAVLFVFSLF